MTFDDSIRLIATVLQAGAIVVTAIFATWGINAWRTQLVGKREFEVAEQAMAAFFRTKEVIKFVRSPFSYAGEAEEHFKEQNIDAKKMPSLKKSYFVTFRRMFLKESQEAFVDLQSVIILARLYLPAGTVEALSIPLQQRQNILASARTLIDGYSDYAPHDESPEGRALIMEMRAEIWDRMTDKDKVMAAINEAESTLLAQLTPILKPRKTRRLWCA